MFKADDAGTWDFRQDRARCTHYPLDSTMPIKYASCHPRLAFAIIRNELEKSPPSLWFVQVFQQFAAVVPTPSDPLGQREEPALAFSFARYGSNEAPNRYVVEFGVDGRECAVLESTEDLVTRLEALYTEWLVEHGW